MPEPARPTVDRTIDRTTPEPARSLRGLVPFEIVAVLLLAAVRLPDAIPVALPLLALASCSRWARGLDWGALLRGDRWITGVAAAAGLAALATAVLAGAPVIEAITGRAVQWSAFPVVRGNATQLFVVALVVVTTTVATELAMRGWLVERMLELSPGPPILPVLVGALAEALITPGSAAARLGTGAFGAGLGWIYVAGGRTLVGPLAARLTFALGAVALEALQLIG
ncbi:MAG: CPBP family glutamic-type intramembrane protease [Kofleriaceae bacterium]